MVVVVAAFSLCFVFGSDSGDWKKPVSDSIILWSAVSFAKTEVVIISFPT